MAPTGELRLMRMAEMFKGGDRASVRDLAEYFEVSERTIKRDIEGLRDQVRLDIIYDAQSHMYFLDPTGDRNPPLTADEFAMLSLASELLNQLAAVQGTRFQATLEQALAKLSFQLPPYVSLDVEARRSEHSFGFSPLRGERDIVSANLALLHEAIRSRVTMSMRYFTASRGVEEERRFDPYHLHYQGDSWYAIGYCHLRLEPRTFAVQRMGNVAKTAAHFHLPQDFNVDAYLANAWGLETGAPEALVVRFGSRSATYVRERPWHPSQEMEETDDGGLILRANVHCGGEVLRWVLQYGADAEVIAPAHLREAAAREARGMGQRYGS